MEVVVDEVSNTLNIKVNNTKEALKLLLNYVISKLYEDGSELNKFIKRKFIYDKEGIVFVDEFTSIHNEYFNTKDKSGTVTNKMKTYISTNENKNGDEFLITIQKTYNKKLKKCMNAYLGIKVI